MSPRAALIGLVVMLPLLGGCGASVQERFARAERNYQAQNWARAQAGYESVLKDDPDHFYAHLRLAEVLFDKRLYDVMIGYHLHEAERIMKATHDPQMQSEFRRVRDKILAKALKGGNL